MRVVRGLLALAVLLGLLLGIPAALVALGGNPLPGSLGWSDVLDAVLSPDDGTILVGLITVVAWLAWLVFALSVVAELISLASGYRIRVRLPGLGGPQRLVAGLLLSVAALGAGSQPGLAAPPTPVPSAPAAPMPEPSTPAPPTSRPPTSVSPAPSAQKPAGGRVDPARVAPAVAPGPAGGPATVPIQPPDSAEPPMVVTAARATPSGAAAPTRDPARVRHTVAPGDDLWSLAERYYGEGRQWRRIALANPDRLSGGPDRLVPGWSLVIPGAAGPGTSDRTVAVRPGDSLSAIADRVYGSQTRWDDLYEANRAQIQDPDEIDAGMRLLLPEDVPAGRDRQEAAESEPEKPRRERAEPGAKRFDPQPDRAGPPEVQRPAPPTDRMPTRPVPADRVPGQPVPVDPAAARPVPADPAPTQPVPVDHSAQVPSPPGSETDGGITAGDRVSAELLVGTAAVGGLLAAGLLGGLLVRRRGQLLARPLGRRIPVPAPAAVRVETALGRRQRPLSLRTLDLTTRAMGAHARTSGTDLPRLELAFVADDRIELVVTEQAPPGAAPRPLRVEGRRWVLPQEAAHALHEVPGVADALRPYPALVTLGTEDDGTQVLADLEALGILTVDAEAATAEAFLAALAVELSFSPWAEELTLTLVGTCAQLPDALGRHGVQATDDLETLLDRLERRAAAQRSHRTHHVLAQHRSDPELADPWAPEVVLLNVALTEEDQRRLARLVLTEPRVATAAVSTAPVAGAGAGRILRLRGSGSNCEAELSPDGRLFTPQLLEPPAADAVIDLVRTTGRDDTDPAPWWNHSDAAPADPPQRATEVSDATEDGEQHVPDNVAYLGRRLGGAAENEPESEGERRASVAEPAPEGATVLHPTLLLFGPIELVGATGPVPPRAGKSCLEYCGWLLEHPGTSAQAMADALVVAEGTRRSNLSRLRSWLGSDPSGQPYLPDAYTGRIALHPAVSSDWQRLTILTGGAVNRCSTAVLESALQLVRGAPLADAAPYQWHWAEELRTDMASMVRDIGVELATRALDDGNLGLARRAAARALVAAPGDELLLAARIRTEHRAGNAAEVERLALQLAGQARTLGVDLSDATVQLLQQVVEGRPRARMA